MNAKDLRIGNCVLLDTGLTLPDFHIIRANDIQVIDDKILKDISIKPIPLTDEIILERGFNKNYNIKNKGFIIECDGAWLLLEKDLSKKNPTYVIWYSLNSNEDYQPLAFYQYLHQLQNLYFALTGQEL